LSVGDVDFADVMRVWWREVRVGLLLGFGMGIAAYFRAVTWSPDPMLGVTVGVAIMGIVLWANSAGAVLPLIASRIGVDPTLVAGPIMSTLVDATGLFIYFTLAGLILRI
jgi:magnesium transporter